MLSGQKIEKPVVPIMKENEKIDLSVVRDRLQARMNYPHPDFALEVLLYGWCKQRRHTKNWLSDVKRRGWLTLSMARDFASYCGYMFV
jgi:hypothetical protein